jgi:hypothetical protein
MGWLDSYKNKFDAEEAEKEKESKVKSAMWKRYREDADKALATLVKNSLQELVGKKTKDGKVLRIEADNGYCAGVIVYAGDEKLLSISYYYQEGQDYDGDGMSWGNGSYSLIKNMYLYRPSKSRYGSSYDKGRSAGLDEEELAYYLLTILE